MLLTLSDLHVWCLTLAIHEMTAINEIIAKIDLVPFMCNRFIVLRKWAHRRMLLQKRCFENISKFQQILATAMESISRKGSFLKWWMCFGKNNSVAIVFLHCDINQFKTLKASSPFIDQERTLIFSFSISWSGEIFPFPLTFPNEGWSCAA